MRVTLEAGGLSYEVGDGGGSGCNLTDGGLRGWYGTPSAKVGLTERSSGDGAHSVPDEAILYSARTVTMEVRFEAADAARALSLRDGLAALAHRIVRVGVADALGETWAEGFLEVDCDLRREWHRIPATLTIVCPDPRRYGTERVASIVPTGDAGGGLLYDEGAGYLLLPVQFAGDAPEGNSATLANGGTSTAYPTITVEGSFPSGVTISHAGGELAYPAPIGPGAPLVLDSLTRTVSVLGVDVTRALARRDFPVVAPGGTVTISALAEGTGTVTATVRDTYI